ncbi:MAG TPA: methyltransferase domain-containing protein [Solirubrobacteraceae bacterium]|nr:methyltransferase domain-containing protein [Solirubrobacteraceae bacterium]
MPDYLQAEIAHARELGFPDPVITRLRSQRQRVELVEGLKGIDLRVYLDGEIQCSSDDEYRYHELLVHPAMALPARRVLVVGGGTGNVVRELVRYADLQQVVLVDPDEAITAAAAAHPALRRLNGGAMLDERVEVVHADATRWVRAQPPAAFDVAVLDLPDPAVSGLAGLYSAEFLRAVARLLVPGGRMAAQACSPWLAPRVFWCEVRTARLVRARVVPLWTHVPSFGEWGFHLSSDDPTFVPSLRDGLELRWLTPAALEASALIPADRREDLYPDVRPTTDADPVVLGLFRDSLPWVLS